MYHDQIYHPILHTCTSQLRDAVDYERAFPCRFARFVRYTEISTNTLYRNMCNKRSYTVYVTRMAPSTPHRIHTFSAKEKDSETGLSYFGSRYYSSDLSIWLSVDPMSDKYPSQSPYVYCANNPIKLVDPKGEDWFENELTGDVYYSKDYRKGDEKLIDGEGWKWMGENDMFGKTADEAIAANIDKADVYTEGNSYDRVGFSGTNAKEFMANMGYKSVPTQAISYEDVYQSSVLANPYQHIFISYGCVVDYAEKIGYVPSNYKEKGRITLNTIYGKFDPIKNNMPSVSRVSISYQTSNVPAGFSLFLHAMNGRHDYVNRVQTNISNYKGNIPLLNTFLKKFPR